MCVNEQRLNDMGHSVSEFDGCFRGGESLGSIGSGRRHGLCHLPTQQCGLGRISALNVSIRNRSREAPGLSILARDNISTRSLQSFRQNVTFPLTPLKSHQRRPLVSSTTVRQE